MQFGLFLRDGGEPFFVTTEIYDLAKKMAVTGSGKTYPHFRRRNDTPWIRMRTDQESVLFGMLEELEPRGRRRSPNR